MGSHAKRTVRTLPWRIASAAMPAALACAGIAHAEQAPAIDEPIVDDSGQLVYPDGAAIPKSMTPIEAQFMDQYLRSLKGVELGGSNCCFANGTPGCNDASCQTVICSIDPFCCDTEWDQLCADQANDLCEVCGGGPPEGTDPPVGPVVAPPEYAPTEAIFFAWQGASSWKAILANMGAQITTAGDADLIVYVESGGDQSAASSSLAGAGANMSRVQFKLKSLDSIWIRDYGPRFVYEGGVRVVTDHTYNRPRPNDNGVPAHYASTEGYPYALLPLIHGGGNYHLDIEGAGFATELITNENAFFTPGEVIAIFQDYWGLATSLFDPFPTNVDATQHIDMWMIPVAQGKVIISDWPVQSGSIQDLICDAAAVTFAANGYTVFRTPARTLSGTHYTYTNAVICNDIALVPTYTASGVSGYNSQALSVWAQALPGKTIVPINAQGIVSAAGVLHCIVKHKPENSGGASPVVYLRTQLDGLTLDPDLDQPLQWISDDDVAVVAIDLELSTDGGSSFQPIALGIADSGAFAWDVPDVATGEAVLRITARDQPGNTGSFQTGVFAIDGTITPVCEGDINGDGFVDSDDLGLLLGAFGTSVEPGTGGDITGDGLVNSDDLGVLLGAFGGDC
ncbi:MAG: agmatine deiminase family protein [Phycisphaerales bacterium]